ncbi:hypothetical protein [Streptomyces sp. NBC_00151]|uniref:hypothetical protein n=1 Tax=Streptomyces sp. NBC_00151 TaxID=2975669 RepID=UPI002DD9D56C|nr:hypothetical protein [Streptomyces sp. NBC_00151]WRZ43941.1 hypothetical protein OG915_41420 [Streptomyces sp. NBC_00151]
MIRNADRRELLGIHPAIRLPAGAADELDAELPTYVTRDMDADVRDALRATSRPGSAGGFLLLCGAAATGRTRCAYEAARACLSDWKLYIPGDAAEPVEQVDSGADFGRTVIRLDELHRFVVEGGRWGGMAKRAGVRTPRGRLLGGPQPGQPPLGPPRRGRRRRRRRRRMVASMARTELGTAHPAAALSEPPRAESGPVPGLDTAAWRDVS